MPLTRQHNYTREDLTSFSVAGPHGLRSLIRTELEAGNLSGITGTEIVTLGKEACVALLLGESEAAAPAPAAAQKTFALSAAIAPPAASTAPSADAASRLAEALAAMMPAQAMDENRVRLLAHEEATAAMNNGAFPVDRVQAIVAEAIAGLKSSRLEIVSDGVVCGTVEGLRHYQFDTLVKVCTARRKGGKLVNAFLYGAPGSGKSYTAAQVADGLGAPFFSHVCSPADTASKVIGFQNKATGEFVEGIAYRWFKTGGLLFVDELCNADPTFPISLNTLAENDYFTFPNGETVERHADTFLIVADNTNGTGSKGGMIRRALDASTRSRFAFIRWNYDADLELALAPCAEWFAYVQKVRTFVATGTSAGGYVTPRATYDGCALLAAGIAPEDVAEMVIFGPMGIGEDARQSVLAACGNFSR